VPGRDLPSLSALLIFLQQLTQLFGQPFAMRSHPHRLRPRLLHGCALIK
jgi:hypothetical protein